MRLLLLRHAIAEDRDAFARRGGDDSDRPLTGRGRKKLFRAADALSRLLPDLALVATSPLLRTRQSAEILTSAYATKPVLSEVGDLAPDGAPSAVVKFLQAQKSLPVVALVGHEPGLSRLAGLLLTGSERTLQEFRKGGGCLLDFPGRVTPGAALLLWHLEPAQLRALA